MYRIWKRGQREYGTYHLSCCHAHSFDRKLPSAHIEEVLETWSEQVNDEDVMEPLLAKVVYLRNAGCGPDEREGSQRMHGGMMMSGNCATDYIRLVCDRSDIRPAVEVPLLFGVPVCE